VRNRGSIRSLRWREAEETRKKGEEEEAYKKGRGTGI